MTQQMEQINDPTQATGAPVAEATRSALYSAILETNLGRKMVAGISALGLGGGAAALVGGNALATGTATAANEVTQSSPAPGVTVEVQSGSASAYDVATKKVTFLINNTNKAARKDIKEGDAKCFWTKPGQKWQNSYRDASGNLVWFTETTPAELCKTPNGLVKHAGGKTGIPCDNEARMKLPKHAKVVTGEIKVVSSFNQDVHLKAVAKAAIAEKCGFASASASVTQDLHESLKVYLKSKKSTQLSVAGKLYDKAEAKANASVHCADTTATTPGTTVTTPGTTTTTTTPTSVAPSQSLTHIQEVDTNSTNDVRDTITGVTVGDKLLTCFDANYGSFAVKCFEGFATSPVETVDDTYTAPTEAGLTDTISATTLDETTGVYANPNPVSESFPVQSGNPVTGRP